MSPNLPFDLSTLTPPDSIPPPFEPIDMLAVVSIVAVLGWCLLEPWITRWWRKQ